MNNQEILNTLSALEEEFYYRYSGGADRENISFDDCMILHSEIDSILTKWHKLTGLTID